MPLKLDTLVELQDRYSNVYPLSPTGARGWVRARRELPKMEPEVYIEWDKAHWRYHGEHDGWTFEHHFSPVDDSLFGLSEHQIPSMPSMPPIPPVPNVPDLVTEAHRKLEAERCEQCGDIHDGQNEFVDSLMEAQEAALGSDGYFMIILTPRQEGELTIYEPRLFTEALTPTARKVIEAQLVDIASQLFARQLFGNPNDE